MAEEMSWMRNFEFTILWEQPIEENVYEILTVYIRLQLGKKKQIFAFKKSIFAAKTCLLYK